MNDQTNNKGVQVIHFTPEDVLAVVHTYNTWHSSWFLIDCFSPWHVCVAHMYSIYVYGTQLFLTKVLIVKLETTLFKPGTCWPAPGS